MDSWIDYTVNEQVVKAIYFTLLHSLWQGAIIAGLVGMMIMATKRSVAKRRYHLLLGSLLLFVVCSLVTFSIYIQNRGEQPLSGAVISNKTPLSIRSPQVDYELMYHQVVDSLTEHAVYIVMCWFFIICLKSVQLTLGLCRMSYMKRKQVVSVTAYWNKRLKILSTQLGISKTVKLMESRIVKVPLTMGYLKPVILLPIGLLTSLPTEQVEAILLHELAHIQRRDYIINIVQRLLEILFFFNPAIWWLSSLLRTERENCCDDLAIEHSGNKSTYIKALVSFEEHRCVATAYATAITGSENHLIKRIKRIIYNQHKTLNPMEKFILTTGLLVSSMLAVAFTSAEKPAHGDMHSLLPTLVEASSAHSGTTSVVQDSIPVLPPSSKTNNRITKTEQSQRLSENARESAEQAKLVAEHSRKQTEQLTVNMDSIHQQVAQVKIRIAPILQQIGPINVKIEPILKQVEQLKISMAPILEQVEQLKLDMEPTRQQIEQLKLDMKPTLKQVSQLKLDMEPTRQQIEQLKLDMKPLLQQVEQLKINVEPIRQHTEQLESQHELLLKKHANENNRPSSLD